MKTIKIIDLLNKIANKEEVPKKIKKGDRTYKYNGRWEDYYYEPDDDYFFQIMLKGNRDMSLILNDKVEIIEEEKDIEKLARVIDGCVTRPSNNTELMNKLNEVIDAVNELKREK